MNKITVKEFVEEFKTLKIQNSKVTPTGVEDYINKKLEIRTYVPFIEKCNAVKDVVNHSVDVINGMKKVDSINQYISFVIIMITLHTSLEMSENPVDDYDALCEIGLLERIIDTFKKDYDECNVLLKMMITDELNDNNLHIIVGKFLNGILGKLDGVTDILATFFDGKDAQSILEGIINKEDMTKILSFVDKIK